MPKHPRLSIATCPRYKDCLKDEGLVRSLYSRVASRITTSGALPAPYPSHMPQYTTKACSSLSLALLTSIVDPKPATLNREPYTLKPELCTSSPRRTRLTRRSPTGGPSRIRSMGSSGFRGLRLCKGLLL